ncbi:MAG: hypothetical protein K5673_03385 [Lachnospiraceae bacterium]|nr:hypothetical protein [Lachnospiraceae bacterium]
MIKPSNNGRSVLTGMIRPVTVLCLSLHLILTILLTNAYMVEEAHHICSEEDCPICENLRLCDQLLRQTSGGVSIPIAVYDMPLYQSEILPDSRCIWLNMSPVGDKVRMND